MTEGSERKPTALFWIIAVIFVIWGLIGCSFYLAEVMMSDAAYSDAFGPELAGVRGVYPTWAMAAYATAVWSGLIAAILFIFRKRISVAVFMFSLGMAIFGFIPSFTNPVLKNAAGEGFWVMPLIVVCIGIFEIIFSRKQRANGILR